MNVLVLFERSGVVRDEFIKRGHNAWSCDLMPSRSDLGPHFTGDWRKGLTMYARPWDLVIAHPPCTYLAVSGNRWYAGTERRERALRETADIWHTVTGCCEKVALENPRSVLGQAIGPPTQRIQPWQFGHDEAKLTCLWLHGLDPLIPEVDEKPDDVRQRIWLMGQTKDRQEKRSRTYEGIAAAMAWQWG